MTNTNMIRTLAAAGAALTIGAAAFAAGHGAGYQAGNQAAAETAAQEIAAAYSDGYTAGEEAAADYYTVNGWYIDTTKTPSGEIFYSICSTETGNGYGIYIACDDGLEMMTTETPAP